MKKIKSMSINGKAVAMCKMGGGIMFGKPNTYEALEYIESTGTQWIDTGFGFMPTDQMSATVAITENIDAVDKYFVAPTTWEGSANKRFVLGGFYRMHFTIGYGAVSTDNTLFLPITNTDNDVHKYAYSQSVFYMEDLGLQSDCRNILFGDGSTDSLKIFYGYDAPTKCRIYDYEHTKDGLLVRSFLPCRRIADGELGMYDTVTKQFFTNQGTGTFTAGEPTGRKF